MGLYGVIFINISLILSERAHLLYVYCDHRNKRFAYVFSLCWNSLKPEFAMFVISVCLLVFQTIHGFRVEFANEISR